MSFDATVPRTLDLHRKKLAERKKDHEWALKCKQDDERRKREARQIVEVRLGSFEDRPL